MTLHTDLGLTDTNNSCACGTGTHAHAEPTTSAHQGAPSTGEGVIREHYSVGGMTCSHCVASVTEEVSALEGVQSVSVNLNAGGTSRIMVVSSKPVPADQVRAAVIEAGYTVVDA
ncbi:heavy-metal-associated domain-containing protein [Subtercola sp. RTI3]|uniref:heavy-metal-associated domain-containing protein n=1 Tax=Subtercola sp. RTI3 TaxID=3048639 RepID=UPI002B23E933|nr:heavy-metal-associated domain-containing protein [Subtercola sp. RTI3]MEA9986772.1 heavy-metal-associated domain-containing protein [Subtercola sp. RTI3]